MPLSSSRFFSSVAGSKILAAVTPTPTPSPTPTPTPAAFKELAIGGGGWLVGMDMDSAGGMIAKADVYGGYIKTKGDARWKELFNTASMPAEDIELYRGQGVYETRFAPSNAQRIYMQLNGWVYRTSNRAATWTKTAFTRLPANSEGRDGNNAYRWYGPKMAVDPINPDVVIATSVIGGVQISRDAGETWTTVTGLPAVGARGWGVCFDPTSATVSGRKQGIYLYCDGTGLYRSTDGGVTFAAVAGGPTQLSQIAISSTGKLWITCYQTPGSFDAYMFDGTNWTTVNVNPAGGTARSPYAVAIHPTDPNRIAICAADGRTSLTTDGGVTWGSYKTWTLTKAGSDVPWLADTGAYFLSAGQLRFDPTEANKLYMSMGVGVIWCNPIVGTGNNIWRSETAGIEELVANTIISIPGGDPLTLNWDRAAISIADPEVFPTSINVPIDPAAEIIHGWHAAYSPQSPMFVGMVANSFHNGAFHSLSGYSVNGGKSFTNFATLPPDMTTDSKLGGNIAVCDTNTIMLFPSDNARPYRSTDRGATWTRMTFPGVTDTYVSTPTGTPQSGWGSNYRFKRSIVTADQVTEGTFYAYNFQTGSVFRTTDKGATWTQRASGLGSKVVNVKLRAVPGTAGKMYLCDGNFANETLTSGNTTGFLRSVDGGATFSPAGTIVGVFDFGFGKAVNGSTPTIVAAGFVNGVFGVYWSADDAATWTLIEQFPASSLDQIVAVNGDMNIAKRFYVGLYGSSYRYVDVP